MAYPVLKGLDNLDKIAAALHEHGVVVIPNVFTSEECDGWMSRIIGCLEQLANVHSSGKVTKNLDLSSKASIKKTWVNRNLPPQVRYGLFQNYLSHLQPSWEIRKDP